MTETPNTPARVTPTEIARREAPVGYADTDDWINVMGSVVKLADHIASTQFVPKDLRGSAAAVTAAILYGREVGLPPMAALTQTHVIEGKPAASAEAMRGLVIGAGHEIEVTEATGSVVTMRARRRGTDAWTSLSWSLDMARAAGLAGKDNWKKYPRQMLTARCSAELIRMVFPDVIHGLRALEEYDTDPLATTEALQAAPAVEGARVRRTARRALPAAPVVQEAPTQADAAPVGGPPLPGEDGYETPPVEAGSGTPSTGVHDEEEEKCPVAHDDGRPCRREADHDGRHYYGRETGGELAEPVRHEDEVPVEDGGETPRPVEDEPVVDETPPPAAASPAQVRMMQARMSELGIPADDADEQRTVLGAIIGRPLTSRRDITREDAKRILDTLARVNGHTELLRLVDTLDTAGPS